MFKTDYHNQTTLEFAQGGYLSIAAESFITDRKAANLARHTILFYRNYLREFLAYCDGQAITHIQEISADFLRRYLLSLEGLHNPGGIHASFRTLRVFFRWLESEEVLDPEWKNPIKKVRAPKVGQDPIEPIPMEDILALIKTCKSDEATGLRDKAIFLSLLDTGARAQIISGDKGRSRSTRRWRMTGKISIKPPLFKWLVSVRSQ